MSESNTRKYYDGFSRTYSDERESGYFGFINSMEAALVHEYVSGNSVLELGCGTGLILDLVSGLAISDLVGVDLSPGMLADARSRGHRVVCGSALKLPFPDASFDIVYSFKVLPHVPDLQQAFKEAARVLRPGGTMLVELYNPWSMKFLGDKLRSARSKVYLRHDSPVAIRQALPPGFESRCISGIRIFGPTASCYRGTLGRIFTRIDRAASRSPLKFLGGYQVHVIRRRSDP